MPTLQPFHMVKQQLFTMIQQISLKSSIRMLNLNWLITTLNISRSVENGPRNISQQHINLLCADLVSPSHAEVNSAYGRYERNWWKICTQCLAVHDRQQLARPTCYCVRLISRCYQYGSVIRTHILLKIIKDNDNRSSQHVQSWSYF